MKPLKLITTDHRPAVYIYGTLSNLLRITETNRIKWIESTDYITETIPNQHPLVQLLSLMNIQADWDKSYLLAMLEMQYDNWASVMDMTCIYNKGKMKLNAVTGNGYNELLISYPPNKNRDDYFNLPLDRLTPIIPLYNNNTDISYDKVSDLSGKADESKVGVVGIDIVGLGIGYWRYLNEGRTSRLSPHYYLTQFPLINARLLQHRLSFFNAIYNALIKSIPIKDQLHFVKGPTAMVGFRSELIDYAEKVVEWISTVPSYSPHHLLLRMAPFSQLTLDPLYCDGGRYDRYAQTNAIYQLPVIKLFTLSLAANNQSFNPMGTINSMTDIWDKQDISGMIRSFIPNELQTEYRDNVSVLLTQNKLSR